jgi:hypothetical protein
MQWRGWLNRDQRSGSFGRFAIVSKPHAASRSCAPPNVVKRRRGLLRINAQRSLQFLNPLAAPLLRPQTAAPHFNHIADDLERAFIVVKHGIAMTPGCPLE